MIINKVTEGIRINNALATADINIKKHVVSKWENLSDIFMDEKYGKVAQLLSDTTPIPMSYITAYKALLYVFPFDP